MMQAKCRHPSNPPSVGIQENGLRSLVHVHVCDIGCDDNIFATCMV